MAGPFGEADKFEELVRTRRRLAPRRLGQAQRSHDIALRAQAGKQVERLEDDADGVATVASERLAGEPDQLVVPKLDRP